MKYGLFGGIRKIIRWYGTWSGHDPNLTGTEIKAIQWAKDKLVIIQEYYPELFQ